MLLAAVVLLLSVALLSYLYLDGVANHSEQPPPDAIMKRVKNSAFTYRAYSNTPIGRKFFEREMAQARQRFPNGHSAVQTFTYGDIMVIPIPYALTNYTYLIINRSSQEAVAVDIGDCALAKRICDEHNVHLVMVLTTHKHWDHAAGNLDARKVFGDSLRVLCSVTDKAPGCTETVVSGQFLDVGPFQFRCMATPGHTRGHLVFILQGMPHDAPDCLFTGDLLFLAGCGRNFEGTCAQLQASLDLVTRYSDNSLVWPGHEYAQENLAYALTVEPSNSAAREKNEWVRVQREERLPTCPSTIAEEKTYNPFLRTHIGEILDWCDLHIASTSKKGSKASLTMGSATSAPDVGSGVLTTQNNGHEEERKPSTVVDGGRDHDRDPDTSHHFYAHDHPHHEQSRRLRAFTKLRNGKNSFSK